MPSLPAADKAVIGPARLEQVFRLIQILRTVNADTDRGVLRQTIDQSPGFNEAEAFEQFHSRKERKYPYYRIYVKHFIVFYVVIPENDHKVMEIRRFLYGKSNWKKKV